MVTGESTKETVKTIARGMPGESGVTVVTTLVCFFHFAREAAGALGTRHSLRPLNYWANDFCKTSGDQRRGNAESYLEPSSPRNGFAVVAGGASLAVHLHRWASLEG